MTFASRKKFRSAISEHPQQPHDAHHTSQHTAVQAHKPSNTDTIRQSDPTAVMVALIPRVC
jgi:hypothetical protein